MKFFGCTRPCLFPWRAVVLSLLLVMSNEVCFSQAKHLGKTKEVTRGMTNDVLIHEGPIDPIILGRYSIRVRAPYYLEVNIKELKARAFHSPEKNFLQGIVEVTPSVEAPLGITNFSLILSNADEEKSGSEKISVEVMIPLKVISIEEYEAKKSESQRVFHRAQQWIGIVIGGNIAKLTGGDVGSSHRTGFGIGAVLDLSLGKNIALRLEPMYLEKRAKDIVLSEDVLIPPEGIVLPNFAVPEYQTTISYLEVPVFLKLAFKMKASQPYILAGPSVGLLLSAEGKAGIPALGLFTDTANIDGLMNFIDFGLSFGMGASILVGKTAVFLEGRYTIGLTKVFDEGKAAAGPGEPSEEIEFVFPPGLDIKTRGIQIMTGITFPFGGY